MPGQHHHGSPEPQRRGARCEPCQQGERCRDLVPAGEVVLDQERAVIAKRFRFDVEINEIMKALAHGNAGTRAAGLRRTKNSEPHDPKSQIHAAVGVGIQPIALYRSTSKWPTALTLPHMAGM